MVNDKCLHCYFGSQLPHDNYKKTLARNKESRHLLLHRDTSGTEMIQWKGNFRNRDGLPLVPGVIFLCWKKFQCYVVNGIQENFRDNDSNYISTRELIK